MDAFDYGEHFFAKLVQAYDPGRVLQIEFQPGVHCDLYRCPYCYGHGQAPMAGTLITAEDVARVLDELEGLDPLIEVSGVATEPLTHPEAAGILREIRKRNLRLALHTKGYRLDDACAEALTMGTSACFVSLSLDAANASDYVRLHDIPGEARDAYDQRPGREYFEKVASNLRRLQALRKQTSSAVQVRASVLLFEDNCSLQSVAEAVDEFADYCDCVRFSLPQDRNDGVRVGNLPGRRRELLERIETMFAEHPKVRVLTSTSSPDRDPTFRRCRAQWFQAVIDRCGNVFPCPQVAVSNYDWLSYGNVRDSSLKQILASPRRRALFEMDVSAEMKCRICDRKDEAINVTLDRLLGSFPPEGARYRA